MQLKKVIHFISHAFMSLVIMGVIGYFMYLLVKYNLI